MQATKKFALDISWVFISQVITLATSFLLSLILGRFLGAFALGLYTMTLTIYIIASLVGGFGIPIAIVKYVAEYKDNKVKLDNYVTTSIINSFVFGVIAGLFLFTISGKLASIFNILELKDLVKIIAFSLPFLAVNNTMLGLLNGLRIMKPYSFRASVRSALLFSFTILFIGIGLDVKGAVLALLISEIGTLFLLLYVSGKFFSFVIRDYVKTTKELVKFGSQLFLAGVVYMVNTQMDILLVGYFLMEKDVGIYAIAIALSKAFLLFPAAISTITYPAISEYNNKGMHKAIDIMINKSMKYSLTALSIIGILIIFFSENIILLLLKSEFLPAVMPNAILIFGMIFFGSMLSIGSAFSAVNRPDISFKINILVAVVNLSLGIILIPTLGIIGAAISTGISFSILTIATIYLLNKILNVKIDIQLYSKVLLALALIIISFFILKNTINLFLLISILFSIYIVSVNAFVLTAEDKKDLRGAIKQILRKAS